MHSPNAAPAPSNPLWTHHPSAADAARAFRQLRVRPARSGVEGGGPVGGEHGGGRARSPKKRKASVGIDKEFILQDDKVKRNTGKSGAGRSLVGLRRWQGAPLVGASGLL